MRVYFEAAFLFVAVLAILAATGFLAFQLCLLYATLTGGILNGSINF